MIIMDVTSAFFELIQGGDLPSGPMAMSGEIVVTPKPRASKWVKDRLRQWGPFVEIKRDETHVFLRGLTLKPNGEEWIGWMPLKEIEIR